MGIEAISLIVQPNQVLKMHLIFLSYQRDNVLYKSYCTYIFKNSIHWAVIMYFILLDLFIT